MVRLLGHGSSFDDDPDARESWDWAVEHVAQNVAADNAEANDRIVRGEAGWEFYWPLPGRAPRRT